jgi:hypothetical protein
MNRLDERTMKALPSLNGFVTCEHGLECIHERFVGAHIAYFAKHSSDFITQQFGRERSISNTPRFFVWSRSTTIVA